MDKLTLKRAIELNDQLEKLEDIERCIIVGAKDHWWSITDAGNVGIELPEVLRKKFETLVLDTINETKKEIENL